MSKKLLKFTALTSLMTMVSRISGLVRDAVMANVLGAGSVADAFFVAFRIPNFLRRIFGEGAFSQSFVPVFTEMQAENTTEAKHFVAATAGRLGLIVFVLSVLGVFFSPEIVKLFAPGFIEEPEKFALTVDALRIMFPYLFFISLVAMSGAILNTLNQFVIPAVTPVLLNICLILALVAAAPYFSNVSQALAYGVITAGVVQLLFQLPSLKKSGVLLRPTLNKNIGTNKVFRLMLPAMLGVSVAQINTLVNTVLASFLVTGSVSWLYYSDRLMEFPVGVFGIALATVVLPSLSKEYQKGTPESFAAMMDWALRWVVMIATPAAIALALLAVPLLATMFQYNAFSAADVFQSAASLRAYAIGVLAFILIKVLAPGFYARQNTKTPVRIAMVSIACNIVLSLLLIGPLKHVGLALAIALAAWINATLLAFTLWRQNIYQPRPGWLIYLVKVLFSLLVMAVVINYIQQEDAIWLQYSLWQRIWHLLLLVGSGGISYFASLYIVGLRPHQMLLKDHQPRDND